MDSLDHVHIPHTVAVIECQPFMFCTCCNAILMGKVTTCYRCGSSELELFRVYQALPMTSPLRHAAACSLN